MLEESIPADAAKGLGSKDGTGVTSAGSLLDGIDIRWEKFRLSNGLTVVVHENHAAPVVTCNIWYRVGAKDEPPGKSGFAHLFEHLMFGGSRNLPGQYINSLAEAGATDVNGSTSYDRTNYHESVPTSALDYVLFAESDRMGHFYETINAETLELQRGVVKNEKLQREGQPYGLIAERMALACFPAGHPYAHTVIGSMEDIERASLDDVRAWFKKYYTPSNAVLVLAGDVDVVMAREKIARYFGDIPPGAPLARPLTWVAKRNGLRREILEDHVPDARIQMAWNIPQSGDAEIAPLVVAAHVLGGGFTSRLHQRLVEQAKVALDASAGIVDGLIAGQFVVSVTLANGADMAEVERLVNLELQRFLEEGTDAATVERIKVQIEAGFIRSLGSTLYVADILAKNEVFHGDPGFYRKEFAGLSAVTVEQTRSVARKWLADGVYVLNVVPFGAPSPAAQEVDRSRPPPVGEPAGIRFPQLHEARLSNGIRVVLAERHELPQVECRLLVPGGAALEPREQMGVASLVTALMGHAAGDRDAMAVAEYAQDNCCVIGAGCGMDFATVDLSAFKSRLDQSLDLYADIVLRPRFEQNDLDQSKAIALMGLDHHVVNPAAAASRVIPALMYGKGHAYAILPGGLRSTLSGITREDVVAAHRVLFQPREAIFFVAGDTTLHELLPRLEARFGSWRSDNGKPDIQIGLPVPTNPAVYLIDRPNAAQTVVNACLLAPRFNVIDEFALAAVNYVLGGSFASRINMNLREDKHWTYGVSAGLGQGKCERLWCVSTQVQADKTAESMAEMLREMNDIIGSRPIEAGELKMMQRASVLQLTNKVKPLGGLCALIQSLYVQDLPKDYWDTYANRMRELDVDQVNAMACQVIDPAELVWVVAGDRGQIERDIRRLGFDEIHVIDAGDENLYLDK
jgi:zinc protease